MNTVSDVIIVFKLWLEPVTNTKLVLLLGLTSRSNEAKPNDTSSLTAKAAAKDAGHTPPRKPPTKQAQKRISQVIAKQKEVS